MTDCCLGHTFLTFTLTSEKTFPAGISSLFSLWKPIQYFFGVLDIASSIVDFSSFQTYQFQIKLKIIKL